MGWPKGKPRKPAAATEFTGSMASRTVNNRTKPTYEDLPDENEDRLHIPRDQIPDGMDYQWVTASIFGQPTPQRRARFEKRGWTPVPADRHDGMFMPKGFKGEIEVDGLVLYERPLEISIRARQKEKQTARDQVRIKEAQIMGGDINVSLDSHHTSAVRSNKISKSFERIPVPDD